jgi:glycosyltransferase involved in cell wall biosynthesis
MAKQECLSFVSVVVPVFNESGNIRKLLEEVNRYLKGYNYEVIFVDDGSSDDTLSIARTLASRDTRVKYVALARNFGHQAALRAGLRFSRGDVVISMDGDMQHPPELLPALLAKWHEGYRVVYTLRKDTNQTSWFKRKTAHQFYKLINLLSDLELEEGAADFRLLDRTVVDIINQQVESDLFLRGYVSWLGFNQIGVPYVPAKRFSGKSKYTFRKMLRLATQGMVQFSVKPLQLSIVVGFVFALLGAIYGVFALASYFVARNLASGWTSLIVIVLVTSGVQLMLLGIVGEYVGKVFLQTKQRPDYFVSETNIRVDDRSV